MGKGRREGEEDAGGGNGQMRKGQKATLMIASVLKSLTSRRRVFVARASRSSKIQLKLAPELGVVPAPAEGASWRTGNHRLHLRRDSNQTQRKSPKQDRRFDMNAGVCNNLFIPRKLLTSSPVRPTQPAAYAAEPVCPKAPTN
jgi:hypothetical protein